MKWITICKEGGLFEVSSLHLHQNPKSPISFKSIDGESGHIEGGPGLHWLRHRLWDWHRCWSPTKHWTNVEETGAIPMLHQVMSATRGATDAFSGLGMHANSSLRRLGIKNVEAGIGCGVGIGHGFGIGLALKPGVLHRIQSSLSQAMVKMATKLGIAPGIFDSGSIIPGSLQSSMQMTGGNSGGNVQGTAGNIMQMTSKTTESTLPDQKGDGSLHTLKGTPDVAVVTRSEKVVSSFLQNLTSEDTDLGDMARKLRSENNVLQVLLKHQQVIDELMEENKRLRQVLVEDLKVSPSKLLQTSNENRPKYGTPCSDCFECRRRRRKSVK